MDDGQREHGAVADDGRHIGIRLGEQIVQTYSEGVPDEEVQDLVADVTREILQRGHTLWTEGLSPELAILWGHECINGVQDRILAHMSFLRLAAALVGVDPARAILPGHPAAAAFSSASTTAQRYENASAESMGRSRKHWSMDLSHFSKASSRAPPGFPVASSARKMMLESWSRSEGVGQYLVTSADFCFARKQGFPR